MQQTERHIVRGIGYFDSCVKAKNLYNQSLYYIRQSFFGNIKPFTEYELTGLMAEFNHPDFRALPASTSQQIIKVLFKNWKSYFALLRKYKNNPTKSMGIPKIPKYKKEQFAVYIVKQQARIKEGYIHFPKSMNLPPLKTRVNNIDQVRIIPNSDHYIIEVVYKKEAKKALEYNGNWMGIDLGINNLATCSTKHTGVIYNGKPLKSINHFYNKRKATLQSLLPKGTYSSNRLTRLTNSRNNKVENYIHQVSSKIIKQAKHENITKIIIGNNSNWKQKVRLGKAINRSFTSIPHSSLINKIKYKGLIEGIEVLVTQESYTSKCSALDLEPICKQKEYTGKRKKRGLFVTAKGLLINADINGSLNIARLGLQSASCNDICISEQVTRAALAPKKINILYNKVC